MNPQETHHFNFTPEQINNSLKAVGVICVGVLTLLLLVKTINEVKTYSTIGEDSSVGAQLGSISVSGKSEMFVKPDVTTFSVTIESNGSTEAESVAKAAEIENKTIAFVKSRGIAENDLKTTYYYTTQRYGSKYQPCAAQNTGVSAMPRKPFVAEPQIAPAPCGITESVAVGYVTTESIEVKVRDIKNDSKKVGELISGVSAFGAKASNPMSTVDNPDIFKKKVREEAIIKARQEAEVLAKQLGVKLVRITSFNENGSPYYPAMYDMAGARSKSAEMASPELPVGTNKISADVSITYLVR
jgi:uncharacterized protein YggE